MENASRTFADPHLNINLAHPLDLASFLSDGDPSSDHFLSSEDKLRSCAVVRVSIQRRPEFAQSCLELHYTLRKGEFIESFASANNMHFLNQDSDILTFESQSGSSFIDATFCSANLANKLQAWEILELDIFGSDHRATSFSLTFQGTK